MDSSYLGIAIAAARKKAGLTQDELSDRAGLSYSTLAKIEQGGIKAPSVFTIAAIAQALGITLDDLITSGAPQAVKTVPKGGSGIKFVFSDVNGVLVRFFQRAFVSIATETQANPEVIESTFWHYNESTNKGEMTMAEFNKAVARRLGVEKIDWEKHYFDAIEPIVAMRDCLENITDDYKVGLLSNSNPGFINAMIKKKLLPDLPYSAVVDSSIVGAVKPDPKIYEAAEKASGYSGSEILFIDDSRTNLTAAEKFGWKVMWFDDYRPNESITRLEKVLNI
ncbi:MAG: HAD-IA family hydrolase [Candidatus Saccharimonadales bacterium]|nr:HAD-IA family hydrolase [Candidatus Saccharimonadales bacterium]